jgi:NADH:ubiquinone oxidoreductase subunit 5 (subunit L)/multisubunit Na+/H+ antiporter MnhA subunit
MRVPLLIVGQMMIFRYIFYLLRFLSVPLSLYFRLRGVVLIIDWELIVLGGIPINVRLLVDYMSVIFAFSVFFISGNVFWFGVGYIRGEEYIKRFRWLVFFFVVSMIILIFSGNLLTVLLG